MSTCIATVALAAGVVDAGRSWQNVGNAHKRHQPQIQKRAEPAPMKKRASTENPKFLNNKTERESIHPCANRSCLTVI